MPFLKFSRDKRGYENFYLIEPPSGGRRGGKARPRVLFWFRTPPQVKVGREPFSEEVRKMVETQYPGLTFDWPRIISTPIPPPDISDHWRERRRQEKAAKRAAREDVDAEPETAAVVEAAPPVSTPESVLESVEAPEIVDSVDGVDVEEIVEEIAEEIAGVDGDVEAEADGAPAETPLAASDATGVTPGAAPEQRRRRRRRRGRRGRPPGQPGVPGQPVPLAATEASSAELDASVRPEPPPTNEV